MQKIRLVDGTILNVESVSIVDGVLIISSKEKTAEELQEIFKNKENLHTIELLTEIEKLTGSRDGFTCYGGLTMMDDVKTIHLVQEADKDSERITAALAKALAAETRATQAEAELEVANNRITDLESQLTDTQLALVEIYEGMVSE